jgi:hypothetical protein
LIRVGCVNQIHVTHPNTLGAAPAARTSAARTSIIPGSSHLILLLSAVLVVLIAVEFAHIVYPQVASFHPLPHLDEWRTLILFSRIEQNADAWSLLLVPHAEHRPF